MYLERALVMRIVCWQTSCAIRAVSPGRPSTGVLESPGPRYASPLKFIANGLTEVLKFRFVPGCGGFWIFFFLSFYAAPSSILRTWTIENECKNPKTIARDVRMFLKFVRKRMMVNMYAAILVVEKIVYDCANPVPWTFRVSNGMNVFLTFS